MYDSNPQMTEALRNRVINILHDQIDNQFMEPSMFAGRCGGNMYGGALSEQQKDALDQVVLEITRQYNLQGPSVMPSTFKRDLKKGCSKKKVASRKACKEKYGKFYPQYYNRFSGECKEEGDPVTDSEILMAAYKCGGLTRAERDYLTQKLKKTFAHKARAIKKAPKSQDIVSQLISAVQANTAYPGVDQWRQCQSALSATGRYPGAEYGNIGARTKRARKHWDPLNKKCYPRAIDSYATDGTPIFELQSKELPHQPRKKRKTKLNENQLATFAHIDIETKNPIIFKSHFYQLLRNNGISTQGTAKIAQEAYDKIRISSRDEPLTEDVVSNLLKLYRDKAGLVRYKLNKESDTYRVGTAKVNQKINELIASTSQMEEID